MTAGGSPHLGLQVGLVGMRFPTWGKLVSKQLVLVQPGLNMMVPALTNNMFLTSPHAKHSWCPKAATTSVGEMNFSKLQKWGLCLHLLMRPAVPYFLHVVLRLSLVL